MAENPKAHLQPVPDSGVSAAARPKRGRGRPVGSGEVSRDRILEAALAEFADHGFDGATTASVARISGVTQPLVHYYFGTKSGLWRAATEQLGNRFKIVLDAIEEDAQRLAPEEGLRVMIRRFVYFAATNRQFCSIAAREGATESPRMDWLNDRYFEPLATVFSEIVERGRRDGTFADIEVDYLFFTFFGSCVAFFCGAAVASGTKMGRDPFSEKEFTAYASHVSTMLIDGIRAR